MRCPGPGSEFMSRFSSNSRVFMGELLEGIVTSISSHHGLRGSRGTIRHRFLAGDGKVDV